MDELLTSADAAEILGVGPTAIKRWADSGVLRCIKTPGGHRRFERHEVEQLLRGGASRTGTDDWDEWIHTLVNDASAHVLQARLLTERARLGAWHRVASVVGGVLVELGHRWAAGRLSVVEEHVASARLQRTLAALSESIPVAPVAPRCLLATVEGDEHTLGLSLAELCLREAGWHSEWAGARTRTTDVLYRLATGGIAMVGLSASAASSESSPLAEHARVVGSACQAAGVALALGGDGAWPETSAYGTRFRAFRPFYEFAIENSMVR